MAATDKKRGVRKQRTGRVVSDAMNKTIVVAVESKRAHELYGKVVVKTKKLYAHDEKNDAHVGDTVRVVETRPLSRLKRWRLLDVIARASGADVS